MNDSEVGPGTGNDVFGTWEDECSKIPTAAKRVPPPLGREPYASLTQPAYVRPETFVMKRDLLKETDRAEERCPPADHLADLNPRDWFDPKEAAEELPLRSLERREPET